MKEEDCFISSGLLPIGGGGGGPAGGGFRSEFSLRIGFDGGNGGLPVPGTARFAVNIIFN